MSVRGAFLKEQHKCSCVCSLACQRHPSISTPSSASAECAVCADTFSPDSTCSLWLSPLWPCCCAMLPSVTWIQSSDIYIDMVKLTLWWWKPQFFISWLVFAMWNCNTAFTCIFALKCSVVLQHLRNSQRPLIFLQTLVCKMRAKSLSQSNIPCPCCIILVFVCISLDCPCAVS